MSFATATARKISCRESSHNPCLRRTHSAYRVCAQADNPKRLWQTVNKLLHRKSSSPLPTSPGTSLADSFASFFTGKISKLRLSLTSNPLHHLRTHPLLQPLLLTSQFSPLPRNPKSTGSCPTVQTSNPTLQIPYRPGFLKNVHPYLFPQSPILSTSPSLPASFTPLSRNPLSHHC